MSAFQARGVSGKLLQTSFILFDWRIRKIFTGIFRKERNPFNLTQCCIAIITKKTPRTIYFGFLFIFPGQMIVVNNEGFILLTDCTDSTLYSQYLFFIFDCQSVRFNSVFVSFAFIILTSFFFILWIGKPFFKVILLIFFNLLFL